MTASIFGVYTWQRRSMEEVALDEQAERMAELINRLCTTVGDFKGLVSFNGSREADFHFDSNVNGKHYVLNLTQKSLFLHQGARGTWKTFVGNVHLYDPFFLTGDRKPNLWMMDMEINHLSIRSDQDFYVETKGFDGDYHVFIYPETDTCTRSDLVYMGDAFNDNLTWNFQGSLNMSAINATSDFFIFRNTVLLRNLFYFPCHKVVPYPILAVHLWEPDCYTYTSDELDELDNEHRRLTLHEGDTVRFDRRLMLVDGNHTVEGFVYLVP